MSSNLTVAGAAQSGSASATSIFCFPFNCDGRAAFTSTNGAILFSVAMAGCSLAPVHFHQREDAARGREDEAVTGAR